MRNMSAVHLYHYDLKSLAKSLKLSSIDVIKTSQVDIESHWYRASGPADLYFWKAKEKIVKHQISIYGQVVEWNEFDGVKTGFVSDDEGLGENDVVIFDKEINERVIEQAIEFLQWTEQIEDEVLHRLISNYKFYNRWSEFGPLKKIRSFVKRWTKK